MPRTVVHGDFKGHNVRVRRTQDGSTLLAFDWEMSGWGVPAPDLELFADQTARAAISVYWSLVQPTWPHLDVQTILQWAGCGSLFRLLAAINWDSPWLAYQGIETVMSRLRVYHGWLAHAISL
jgi:aminoglycoside phosphotransferase (APT) family kinase protein